MSWMWRELNPSDSWSVQTRKPLQTAEIGVLMHLYQPIIGAEAVSLYVTLCMQGEFHTASASPSHTHRFLMGLLCLPLDQVLEARYRLEGVGLLKTFKRNEQLGRSFRYEVIPPLNPQAFFQTDVLSITLMNRLGKERYRQVRERFDRVQRQRETAGEEVTKQFHEVFTSLTPSELTIHEDSEAQPLLASFETASALDTNAGPTFQRYALDWEFLRAQASAVGTLDSLTETDRENIRAWAFFYQLDDIALGKALQNPELYNEKNMLQPGRLHEYIKQEYRFRHGQAPVIRPAKNKPTDIERGQSAGGTETMEEVHRQWLAKLSPLELLERYQRGGKVPEADVELVEELHEKYGLPYGVINVLIEFVLLTNDYKLPGSLVKKIAGHWKRANVQTVEQAQELALKQSHRQEDRKGQRRKQNNASPGSGNSAKKLMRSGAGTKTKDEPEKKPAETEDIRRARKAQFEELLGKLRGVRPKGE